MVSRLCFQAVSSARDGADCPLCLNPVRPAEAALRCAGDDGVHHYLHEACLGGWGRACQQFQLSLSRGLAPSCPGCSSCLEVSLPLLAAALEPPGAAGGLAEGQRRFLEEVLDVGRENLRDETWGDPFVEERPYFGGLLGYAAAQGFRTLCAAAEGAALGVRSAVAGTLAVPASRARDLGGSMSQYMFGSTEKVEPPKVAGAGAWGQTYAAPELGGPPAPPSGRKRALLVGCNYPGTQVELSGCANDVRLMRELLARLFGFERGAARLLADEGEGSDGPPTRANVLEGLRWLVHDVQKGDSLFFHFSGHGAQQLDPDCAEEDGYDETICPTDFREAGMIVDGEIFDTLVAPLPAGAKLTVVMDCCHSGTGLDLPFTWDPVDRCWVEDDNPCHSAGDVQLISGCEDSQTSADATVGGSSSSRWKAAGAMTSALCACLEEAERWAAPSSAQGLELQAARLRRHLCYDELIDRMHGKLAQRGFEQRPQLTSSQAFDMALRKPFDPCGEALANQNPWLGRHFRRRRRAGPPQDDDFYTLAGVTPEGVLAASGALLPWAQLLAAESRGPEHRSEGPAPQSSPLAAWGSGEEPAASGGPGGPSLWAGGFGSAAGAPLSGWGLGPGPDGGLSWGAGGGSAPGSEGEGPEDD